MTALLSQMALERASRSGVGTNRGRPQAAAPDVSDVPWEHRWPTVSLEQATDPVRTISYGILKPGPNVPDGVPYVRVLNMREDILDVDGLHRTSPEIARQYARASLQPDDVLVSIRGTYGRVVLVPMSLAGANITQDTARLAFLPQVDARFAATFLRSPVAQGYLKRVARGVAVKGVNIGDLRTLPLPVPPIDEQRRIVEILEDHLSRLEAAEAGVVNAQRRLKALHKSVLLKLIPDVADYPPGWQTVTVEQAGNVGLGRQRHPDWHTGPNMKPYLRVANVFEDRIDTRSLYEMHWSGDTFDRFRLMSGDVLLNEGQTPELLGRPAIYRGHPPEVAFTNSLLRFQAGEGVLPDFALLVFRRHMHAGRFARESRITTNIAHLSAARLKPIEFPIPPLGVQEALVALGGEQLSALSRLGAEIAAARERSGALRRALLEAAFSGRLVSSGGLAL